MLLKEDPTLFPQHLKNSLLNLGLIDKETCTLSTLNTVIFRANKVWFLCWILSKFPPAAATNKQIVGSVSGSILVNIPNTPLERILCRSEQLLRNDCFMCTWHYDPLISGQRPHLRLSYFFCLSNIGNHLTGIAFISQNLSNSPLEPASSLFLDHPIIKPAISPFML